MKEVIFGSIIVLILSTSCFSNTLEPEKVVVERKSEIEVLDEELVLDQKTGRFLRNKKPFTGKGIKFYPNNQLAETATYMNGRRNGMLRRYFANGLLSYEAFYINNKLNGEVKTWWSNGNLRSNSLYLEGIADGEQLQYYKSGQLFKSINLVQGKEEGMQRSWRKDGKLYNNYEAKNGRIFGLKRSSLCFKLENEIIQYET